MSDILGLQDYDFDVVMKAAVDEFGHDQAMESAQSVEELIMDYIGDNEVYRLLARLNNG